MQMNAIDYLLLAALTLGALYTFYRLFLGYVSSRSLEVEVTDRTDVSNLSRADAEVASLEG